MQKILGHMRKAIEDYNMIDENDKILVDRIILIMYNTTRAVLLWRTRKATAAGHTVFRAVEYERTLREGQESAGYY